MKSALGSLLYGVSPLDRIRQIVTGPAAPPDVWNYELKFGTSTGDGGGFGPPSWMLDRLWRDIPPDYGAERMMLHKIHLGSQLGPIPPHRHDGGAVVLGLGPADPHHRKDHPSYLHRVWDPVIPNPNAKPPSAIHRMRFPFLYRIPRGASHSVEVYGSKPSMVVYTITFVRNGRGENFDLKMEWLDEAFEELCGSEARRSQFAGDVARLFREHPPAPEPGT